MNKKTRKVLIVAAKLVLAAGLLAYIISKVPFHDYTDANGQVQKGFLSTIQATNWVFVALAGMVFLISWLTVALRWWYLLRVLDIHITPWQAIKLMFLGQFFNQVVPGTVGGDLVKAYYVARESDKKAAVLVSAFVDRLLGLAELTCLAGIMILVVMVTGIQPFEKIRLAAIVTACVLVLLTGMVLFLLSRRFRKLFHLQKIYKRLPIAHHFEQAGDAARLYRTRIGKLLKAVGITVSAHIPFIGSIWLLGVSLGIDAPWYMYFLFVPVIYTLGAAPITPGGVGLIEGFYLLFFAGYAEDGTLFGLALIARMLPVICALPGSIVALKAPRLPSSEDVEEELGVEGLGDEFTPEDPSEDTLDDPSSVRAAEA